jgi:HAE1 family hydrophobic/amphiphilic exporter-1
VNASRLFIERPVATLLLMLALVVFGSLGYSQLPVSDLPNVDFPTLTVTANLPGANPDTMAAAVASPLEKQFSTIAGIDSMSSSSGIGSTQITLTFNMSRDLDAAAQDVQAAITAAARQLPPLPTPPSYQKVNPADQPILYIALTSPDLPLPKLDEFGQTLMAQRISMVSGVAQVQVYGSQKYAVRVQMNPEALAARNLDLDDVAAAVQAANTSLPAGVIWGPYQATTVQAPGTLYRAEDYRPIIVAYRDGKPVRLQDLGRVVDSVENDKAAAWFRDQRAVVLAIQRQPGTNTVEVARAVKELLPKFRSQMPASVSLRMIADRSELIEESVADVRFTLITALVLVVLVIFLFLRNLSATFIAGIALPLSMIGTFAAMYLLGYSLDNLSLMALTLSVGFVVDDAIVMLENIVRHMERGTPPLQAAFEGSKEIGFTIISMTLSLSAVFIPVLFMGGILGRLFREFAMTIGIAILISGFVSLSLTPMLSSRMLRAADVHGSRGLLYRATEWAFDLMLRVYDVGLRWSLRHQKSVLFLSLLTLGGTVLMFQRIPKGLFPNQDVGQIFGATEMDQGTSFENMVAHQKQIADILLHEPNVEAFMSSVGARGTSGANSGVIFARLTPRAERALSADALIQKLRPQMAQITGIRTYLQNPPVIRLGGMLTKSQYQYTLQSTDTDELYRVAQTLETRLHAIPGLQDVTSDLQIRNPELEVDIDRDKAASMGLSARQIQNALYNAYAGRQISTIYSTNNTYQVILELMPELARDPNALSKLHIRSSNGGSVPIDAVAKIEPAVGPLVFTHLGQLPSVTVSFNLRPGAALGSAIAAVERTAREVLPETVTASFQGTAQAFASSQAGLGALLIVAILVIYMVLGILYESFIHPVTILSALPFAGFGALATLMLFHEDLSIYAFVGVIMLVGLVKKNGIMMIDFALEVQRTEGKSARDAIYEACRVRFRPITMTTVAALMGTLPIALGIGAGAEARRPLGLAVVGGLLFSQVLTLYVTPVFFLLMDRLVKKPAQPVVAHAAAAPASAGRDHVDLDARA